MRQIREVLRLHLECGRTKREIASALSMAPTTVWDYLRRAGPAQLTAARLRQIDDAALEALLYPPPSVSLKQKRAVPEWRHMHRELAKKASRWTCCGTSTGPGARRLRVQLVLQVLRGLGGVPAGDASPEACTRREAVH